MSVNLAKLRTFDYSEGRSVKTGIYKEPVEWRVRVAGHKIVGDVTADLRVHGGPYKAVYLYPLEHYSYWKNELSVESLPFGAFGENLTTEGITEESVGIGDQFQIGSAILQVTQPRMPCFKLALKFGRSDMVKRFWKSRRSGIYFSIMQEGEFGPGDTIERTAAGPEAVTVADVVRLHTGDEWREEVLERALRAPLYGSWKRDIQSRLVERE